MTLALIWNVMGGVPSAKSSKYSRHQIWQGHCCVLWSFWIVIKICNQNLTNMHQNLGKKCTPH